MESKWGYRLTEKADADLDDIVRYIAVGLANPKAASDFVDKLQSAIEEARSFLESGSLAVNEYLPDSAEKMNDSEWHRSINGPVLSLWVG